MTKKELRRIFRERRRALEMSEVERLSDLIAENMIGFLKGREISVVSRFSPMRDEREIDAGLIERRLRSKHPHFRVALPRVAKGSKTLEHVFVSDSTRFDESDWGISEPIGEDDAKASDFDLVVVPLLCFDRDLNRVGYGGGFYDRFLAETKAECLKVGVSLFPPVGRIDEIHERDIPLDAVVTPLEVFARTGR
ncbi:MAG: 5-formyltetrahydrofolate cyclo-ligase [Pyrinomonadaceae bacterium]